MFALEDSQNPQLLKQLALTISRSCFADVETRLKRIQDKHSEVTGVHSLCKRLIDAHKKRLAAAAKRKRMKEQQRLDLMSFNTGKELYETLCFTCHGKDGHALAVGPAKMAANFANSVRLRYARSDALIKIGAEPIVSFEDGTAESMVGRSLYPLVRDALLRSTR